MNSKLFGALNSYVCKLVEALKSVLTFSATLKSGIVLYAPPTHMSTLPPDVTTTWACIVCTQNNTAIIKTMFFI
ncbi:MAG: hypothetical protein ACTHJT_16135 [Cytophaga sp.]|uniref:hypothetical protein n=1 Tax=Cytophaga sp. TaxID=29535 RepID=UPI003F7ED084